MAGEEQARLLGYALRLLGSREYSQASLRKKCEEWLIRRKSFNAESAKSIDAVLEQLVQEGWQNDERFIVSYVRLSLRKGWGPIKIAYHLKTQGIVEEDITKHCQYPSDFWIKQITALLIHKYKEIPPEVKPKAYRFLLGRGFLSEHIHSALADYDGS